MKIFNRTFSIREQLVGFAFLCFGLVAWAADTLRTRYVRLKTNYQDHAEQIYRRQNSY